MTEAVASPYAVIYPLPKDKALKILRDKKTVFVKYQTYEAIPQKLQNCKKIIFYISRANKKIIGECDINSIELLNLPEVLNTYQNDLFLTSDEMYEYSRGRIEKKMTVFKLNNIKFYGKEISYNHIVTMVGQYITKERYEELIKQ